VVNDNFSKQTSKMFEDNISLFKKKSAELIIENSGWGDQVSQHQSELEQILLNLVKNARDKEIEKLANITQKATFDTIEEIVNYPIYQMKDDFWAEIRKPYAQEM
jgi:sugar diacid utilization regulator